MEGGEHERVRDSPKVGLEKYTGDGGIRRPVLSVSEGGFSDGWGDFVRRGSKRSSGQYQLLLDL